MVKTNKNKRKTGGWNNINPSVFGVQLDSKGLQQAKKVQKAIAKDENIQLMKQQAQDWMGGNAICQGAYSGLPIATYGSLIDNYFMGYGYLAQLSQNGLVYSICKTISQEMCRKGIEFKGAGDDVNSDKIKELTLAAEEFKINEHGEWAAFQTTLYGSCLISPKLKDDENDIDSELFIDNIKIGKGDLEYFSVIDPNWYVALGYNTDNPRDQWFYKPEYYTLLGRICHESRVFKCNYQTLPDLMKPSYLFNGIGIAQQALPYIYDFEQISDAIVEIVKRYNINILKTNMESIIDSTLIDDGMCASANMRNRINVMNAIRNNMGTLAIDKETEDFVQVSMQLAGLQELLDQAAQYLSIIPKIPVTKLLGISPGGMNATGESDMRNFYDMIASMQQIVLKPAYDKMIQILQLNLWGEIDEDITWEFCKLEETNKVEDSQIRLNDANRDAIYIDKGVLSSYDARTRLANDEQSGYDELDVDEYDLSEGMAEKAMALPKSQEVNPVNEEVEGGGENKEIQASIGNKKVAPKPTIEPDEESN